MRAQKHHTAPASSTTTQKSANRELAFPLAGPPWWSQQAGEGGVAVRGLAALTLLVLNWAMGGSR